MRRWIIAVVLAGGCGRLGFDPSIPPDQAAAQGCVQGLTAYGDQVCAFRADGTVDCWGSNGRGQLGDNSMVSRSVPAPANITDVIAMASGEKTVCAIKSDQTLWCWGGGTDGQIGDGAGVDRWIPTQVTLPPTTQVLASESHTCALLADNTARCWGKNDFGELGVMPPPTMALAPVTSPISGNLAVTLGDDLTCVLRPDRSVACFGRGTAGELGDGTLISHQAPIAVTAIDAPVVSLAAGCHRHVCAATAVGDVWCWGENTFGEVGTGSTSPTEATPRRVAGVTGAVQVAVGAYHSCARTSTNEVWCWGAGDQGQLGNGAFVDRYSPVRVDTLVGAPVDLQLSCTSSFVLLDDRRVVAWGEADKLGTGETVNRATAAAVPLDCP